MNTYDETPPTPRPEPPTTDEGIAARVADRLFRSQQITQPSTIGRFSILRRIGTGGMGIVDLAYDPRLDRTVALKSLVRFDPRSRERFVQEAKAMARIKHANVVDVHEVIEIDASVHIVMKYIEGTTLADWQRDKDWDQVLDAYVQAGRGLTAAHEAGLLHRDFKPSNVLISSKDGSVCVADFGLAVANPDAIGSTEALAEGLDEGSREVSNWFVGTREYLGPEIYAGNPASVWSDQFSYCVSLWEAICGERPFRLEDILNATRTGLLPLPRKFAGPRWLRRVIARGLEIDPQQRWPTMDALVDTLRHLPQRRRRRTGILAVGALTLSALGLMFASDHEPPCPSNDDVPEFWSAERRAALAGLAEARLDVSVVLATIERELGAHAKRFADERANLCVAYREQETLSAAAFERSNVCLDHAADRTAILVDSLLEPDGSGLVHVDSLLVDLPDPALCRTRVATITSAPRWWLVPTFDRLALDRGWAASAAGDQQFALDAADRVLAGAPSTTVELDALSLRASALQRSESSDARNALRALVRRATSVEADEALFTGLVQLAVYDTIELENDSSARISLDLADLVTERLGRPAQLEASLRAAQAELALLLGDLDEAQRLFLDALELHRGAGSPRAKIGKVEMRLAYVHALRDETELAVGIYSRLLDEQIGRLGPNHVNIGTLELNIGISLADARDWPAARTHLERAAAIFASAPGGLELTLASTSTKLAEVETELGDYESASAHAESAWAVQREQLAPSHSEYGQPLRVLAWTNLRRGDWEASLRDHEALLGLELDPSEQAVVHESIGWLLCRLGRFDAARPHAELATTASDLTVRLHAEAVLVEIELAEGKPVAALARLRELEASLDSHDAELAAALAWLRVKIGSALGSPKDELHGLVTLAWSQADFLLGGDQRAFLRSLMVELSRNRQ